MFPTLDAIRNDLIAVGIDASTVDLLVRQARPAVWLETHVAGDEANIPVGGTKIGGRPDLPAGAAWPARPAWPDAEERTRFLRQGIADPDKAWPWAKPEVRQEILEDARERLRRIEIGQPLSFVAQINFAELWAAGPLDADMPRQGVLSIFYDLFEMPSGFDPIDRVGFTVLFHDGGKPLARREEPAPLQTLAADYRLVPLACRPHACMTPLPLQTAEYRRLNLAESLTEQLWDDWQWRESGPQPQEGGADWRCHHIGGWPTPVQGDMQTECALVSAGHDCGTGEAYSNPALAEIRATATDWLLLVQIGAGDKNDMSWGDNGQLYLWIRRGDLKARRFARAWLVYQCH